MQYCIDGNPDEVYVREITATDHINKALAEAVIKYRAEHPQSPESISEEEEWSDPEGQSYMDSRPEGVEDDHIYLRADDNVEEEEHHDE